MANRLAQETSLYLRQHAENPVDWWPWCDEAWQFAREQDRPVLLSVGYSACHWCHVMAHESFEDPAIADLMNRLFVNIKVDREERPDVDGIYMTATQAMTGRGGWPMTVFCTPRAVPYFAGTYFPPTDRAGMRGFPFVLKAAADAYSSRREDVDRTGAQIREALTPPRLGPGAGIQPTQVTQAVERLITATDGRHGGFGGAPKFPHPAALDLLLRHAALTGDHRARDAALLTLDGMARGGIHDQLGGGFHRYSVDGRWAVPHFEKMLYDNAQLAPVYLHAWQLTGDDRWLAVVDGILSWALEEMRLPGGGFASTQDADTDGVEGATFVWTPEQIGQALEDPESADLAIRVFGVTEGGNMEDGATVLALPSPLDEVAVSLGIPVAQLLARLGAIKDTLLAARRTRAQPARDGKVITAWNGMMMAALAECGAAADRPDWVAAARACAAFVEAELIRNGRVMRSWLDGQSRVTGFLDDHAHLADGLLRVYEATGESRWFRRAMSVTEAMLGHFWDPVGGMYDTAIDGEPLLVRPQTLDDNAVPAGQSTAALLLLRLGAVAGNQEWSDLGRRIVQPLAAAVAAGPLGLSNLGWALQLLTTGMREVAISGTPEHPLVRDLVGVIHSGFRPDLALAWGDGAGIPLLADRAAGPLGARAYVCRGFTCDAPTDAPATLRAQLEAR